MTPAQVEAVFGHEAGHVRHRHIPYFLLFAFCSMLLLSGIVEGLRVAVERELLNLSVLSIQIIAVVCAGIIWAVFFGWVSRRFERQADVFGAWCVTPNDSGTCALPCSVHDPDSTPPPDAVCASAASVFVSALDRVAVLNGIPREERSWRHSSIASRVRFLTALTGDPGRAQRFSRVVRRIKRTLLGVSAVGLLIWFLYVWRHPLYGINAPAWYPSSGTSAGVDPVSRPEQRTAPHARTDH